MTAHYPCPCCGFLTIKPEPGQTAFEAGSFSICPVCAWEDDQVQFNDPDYRGGANTESLTEARRNFREFGASDRRLIGSIRPPRPDETP